MSNARHTFLLSVMSLLCAGCATEGIYVKVMRPAPVNLGQYDVIAIEGFEGNGGADLANELTVALSRTKNPLTGRVDFQVLDRREVDKMLEDLRRHRNTGWDREAMSVLDRWRKAQLVIRGEVQLHSVVENVDSEEWVDPYGVIHRTYTRACSAQVLAVIEATDTDGDKVFDSVRFDGAASDSATAVDEQPPPIDQEALLAAARGSIIHRYLKRMIPHEDWVQVDLYTDGDFPELQIGNGFAKTGAWDRALQSYEQALGRMTGELAGDRYMALFNLGVALEYTNRFEEARKALQEAYAFEQDSMILQEINNVGYREQEYNRLMEQAKKATAEPTR